MKNRNTKKGAATDYSVKIPSFGAREQEAVAARLGAGIPPIALVTDSPEVDVEEFTGEDVPVIGQGAEGLPEPTLVGAGDPPVQQITNAEWQVLKAFRQIMVAGGGSLEVEVEEGRARIELRELKASTWEVPL